MQSMQSSSLYNKTTRKGQQHNYEKLLRIFNNNKKQRK